MVTTVNKSNKMRDMPIAKLLAVMSLPAITSMLIQSLYNIVDSVFLSMVSNEAMDAMSILYPMQMLTLAFAIGIGIGTNSVVSRKLGEKKFLQASDAAKNGLFLALMGAFIFIFVGIFVSNPFVKLFTDNPTTISYATEYLVIVTALSFGMFVEILCSKTLQATGNMLVPMISQIIGAVVNIVLDIILIFGYLGFPALGIKGAAIATVIGQVTAMIYSLTMFKIKSQDVSISLKKFRPSSKQIKNIMIVGVPTIFMNAITSFTIFALNFILKALSEAAITVLGIYFKLQSFVFMPVFGLTQGALPIMGYNYGANNKKRFYQTFKLTVSIALCMMLAGLSLFQFFTPQLLNLFHATNEVYEIGIKALKIISLCFIPAAFGIVITTMFQSIGHGLKSFIMSLLRQVVLLIPFALLFAKTSGLDGIWFCYPLAELICVGIFLPIALNLIVKVFRVKSENIALMGSAVTECE